MKKRRGKGEEEAKYMLFLSSIFTTLSVDSGTQIPSNGLYSSPKSDWSWPQRTDSLPSFALIPLAISWLMLRNNLVCVIVSVSFSSL